jgi:DNA-directed RNA polymerase
MPYATRKAAKIPVMTWGYNATQLTSVEHMDKLYGAQREWCDKSEAFVNVSEGLSRGDAFALGKDLFDRLNETLGPLTAAVQWVTNGAGKIAGSGEAQVHWMAPDGFECMQRKVKGNTRDIECYLSDGSRFQLDIIDYRPPVPNTQKHRSAIAPNVIHSLDATHLRMVARKLEEQGLPMIFIHDSFATHVNHREKLYTAIVEAFAELYNREYLVELKDYWEARYQVELDMPPELGNWDPSKIVNLRRFFL